MPSAPWTRALRAQVRHGLDVRLRHVVQRIRRTGSQVSVDVTVEDAKGTVQNTLVADTVIVTLPLGVMKAEDVRVAKAERSVCGAGALSV